jgi:RNA polymerase sigma factor (TIGR02999 family)
MTFHRYSSIVESGLSETGRSFYRKLMGDLTSILGRLEEKEGKAAEELYSCVYQELRRMAIDRMSREKPGATLQPTALVHEAWLRLGADAQPVWQSRAHFFGAAAEAMRRILVDKARRRQRVRHGADLERVDLDDVEIAAPESDSRVLQISDALDLLAAEDPVKAEVVKLRFFVGLSDREVAEALGLSERTVERHWAYAKVWLLRAVRSAE